MLLYCKECPNLDFKDMEETDKPICLKTGEVIEDFQKQYCEIEEN